MAIAPPTDVLDKVRRSLATQDGWSEAEGGAQRADGLRVVVLTGEVPAELPPPPLEVLYVGEERHVAEERMGGRGVSWVHIGPDGRRVFSLPGAEGLVLTAWSNREPGLTEDLRLYAMDGRRRRNQAPVEGAPAPKQWNRPSPLRLFWDEREPGVTAAVVAACVGLYVVQILEGAVDEMGPMLRMGALPAGLESADKPWLWISYAFLHGGPLHLGFNMLAIWYTGQMLESWIGRGRFWILYVLSAMGGAAAIVFAGNAGGVHLGASGASWGLMAAQGMILWRYDWIAGLGARRLLLPQIGRNLALNAMISFAPGISFAAHFGGGVTGALLVVLGIATAGMRRPGEQDRVIPTWGAWLASLLVGVVVVSALLVWWTGPLLRDDYGY